MKCNFFTAFVACVLGVISKKSLPNSRSQRFNKKLPKWPYHYILHEQWMRVPVGPHPYQHWEFIASFLNFNHLGNVELYFMMILICFSLMTSDSNKIFLCLLANDVSFFVNHRFKSLPITTKKRGGGCLFIIELEDIKITYSRYKSDICILSIFF